MPLGGFTSQTETNKMKSTAAKIMIILFDYFHIRYIYIYIGS